MVFNTFDLITQSEAEIANSSFSISNPPKVMIVLSKNEDKDPHTSLLSKILQAVKVDIQKEALTVIKPDYNINVLSQIKDLGVDKVIAFGVTPKEISLNLNPQLYSLIDMANVQFLFSDPLDTIAKNQDRKKALWSCLQSIFQN